MSYKVIPLNPSNNVSVDLENIIETQSASGYKYVNHQYSEKVIPGKAGCFGPKPATTVHVGFVIFEK